MEVNIQFTTKNGRLTKKKWNKKLFTLVKLRLSTCQKNNNKSATLIKVGILCLRSCNWNFFDSCYCKPKKAVALYSQKRKWVILTYIKIYEDMTYDHVFVVNSLRLYWSQTKKFRNKHEKINSLGLVTWSTRWIHQLNNVIYPKYIPVPLLKTAEYLNTHIEKKLKHHVCQKEF